MNGTGSHDIKDGGAGDGVNEGGEDQESDFNQGFILPPLIVQLRKILDQYPDDTQILKELIQNAEDAGAKVIKFLYDRHIYGSDTKKLHSPALAAYQGPALYAYNDGLFDENDWKGIRMLSQSVKQNDPLKVGYFGMGFKSVFHITDLPSVLSGDRLGMIDPHQRIFSASSYGWNIAKNRDLLTTMRHQLDPYIGLFDCSEDTFTDGYYKGTMFRFPLRNTASPLCSRPYSQDKLLAMFSSFKHDAHLQLVFLRSLERIEMYERDRFTPEVKLLFSIEVGQSCVEEVRAKRRDFLRRAQASDWMDKPIISTYQLKITTSIVSSAQDREVKNADYRYLVTSYYCGGQLSAVFSALHKDPELNFLPWVGTAMALELHKGSSTGGGKAGEEEEPFDGLVFCFLPLPTDGSNSATGLPVHVNGYFALEQNRKYIKWPAVHDSREDLMDKRLLWNQCMLKEALPKAYTQMLLTAIQLHSKQKGGNVEQGMEISVADIYRAYPSFSRIDKKWECILPILFAELFKHPTVHTGDELSHSGAWIEPRLAVFNNLDANNEQAYDVICDVLAASGGTVKLVDAPAHVLQAVRKCCHINVGLVTPQIVATTCRAAAQNVVLHWDARIRLLRYILHQPKLELIDGLELLPLANGGFTTFHYNPRNAEKPIFIATSGDVQQLIGSLGDDFLEPELDKDIKKLLIKAAVKGFTQLKVIDAALLAQLIPRSLPRRWLDSAVDGVIEWEPGQPGHPPVTWLENLWEYLVKNSPRDLSAVEKLPIIPGRSRTKVKVVDGKEETVTVTELVPLSVRGVSLARSMDGISLGTDMEEIAQKLGITVIDDLPDFVKLHPLIVKNYVFSSSYIGVLRAILRLCEMNGEETIMKRVMDRTDAAEKRRMRELFAKISTYELHTEHQDLLMQLPLFETLDGSGGKPSHFVHAAQINLAAPMEKAPFPLSRLLLDVTSTDSQTLGRLLGIRQLTLSQLLAQVVFKDIEDAFYDSTEVQTVMLYVLRHYHQFADADPGFRSVIKSLAFLERSGTLTTADRFYDPEHELLRRMFSFEERFPSGPYADPAVLAVLREIGLRGPNDVDVEDIREAAIAIQDLVTSSTTSTDGSADDTNKEGLSDKSAALLDYLQRHQSKLNASTSDGGGGGRGEGSDNSPEKLSTALSHIVWVRRLVDRPVFYPRSVPWYNPPETGGSGVTLTTLFDKPASMTSRRHVNLIGSVMSVVVVDVSPSLERAFGWDRVPPLEEVVRHLAHVVTSYDPREKVLLAESARAAYDELTRHDASVVRALLDQHLPSQYSQTIRSKTTPTRQAQPISKESRPTEADSPSMADNGDEQKETDTGLENAEQEQKEETPAGASQTAEWVWNGDGFSSPEGIVFTAPFMDLRPFVHSLPADMIVFTELFASFGVQRTCNLTDVLKMIRRKHNGDDAGVNPETGVDKGGDGVTGEVLEGGVEEMETPRFSAAEVKRDLHICISILNELKSHVTDATDLVTLQAQLYLPVLVEERGILKMAPLSDCTYCDEEWLRQGYSSTDFGMNDDPTEKNIFLVHPNVPASTSEALGVPTLMSRMLDAEELDISFGQADSLTHRLNTLLLEYADGFAVPKELVQNADDAGATEVRFLYDERENEEWKTCLIDEGMKECQGPALWVYNDAVFTDEDFENITKLSGATKESKPDKIGRFGLGFNAVYNLTDVPSFVSRHSIVIFDPHITHLGKSIKNRYKPGIRIDLRRHRRNLRRFGNQFRPYNGVFDCDLRADSELDSYNGTLFRFPLRTKQQAQRSEICHKHYDDKEARELLRMLANAGESLLLFTQNVLKISIYHLPKSSSASGSGGGGGGALSSGSGLLDLAEVFHIEKRPIKIIRELTPIVKAPVAAEALSENIQRFIANCSVLRSSTDALSLVRAGVKPDSLALPNSSVLIELERCMMPKSDLLLDKVSKSRIQTWLICNYMGAGESLRMALQEENLLTTVGIAVLLEPVSSGCELQETTVDSSIDITGKKVSAGYRPIALLDPNNLELPTGFIFSYMPLPIRSGLPVHINGSFAISSNRKYICQQNEDDKFDMRPIWNRLLMQDAVCCAYINMLVDLTTLLPSSESASTTDKASSLQYAFHTLWPNPRHVVSICDPFLRGFYKELTAPSVPNSAKLFSDGQRWADVHNTLFLDFDYAATPGGLGDIAVDVFRHCLNASASSPDQIVASLPAWTAEAFRVAEVEVNLDPNRFDVVRFFSKFFLPQIGSVVSESRDKLLLDALRRNDEKLNQAMEESECIPVSPDGLRTRPAFQLVDPTSFLATLYLPIDERFPHGQYNSPDVIPVLRKLGMKCELEHISWDDLVERAEAVGASEPHRACSRQLVIGLVEAIGRKLSDGDTISNRKAIRYVQDKLCGAAFLPVMKKPSNFPLPWNGSNTKFPEIKNNDCESSGKKSLDEVSGSNLPDEVDGSGTSDIPTVILLRPMDVYPSECRDYICCVRPIVDDSVYPSESTEIQKFLRLNAELKEPSVEEVLEQLDVLVQPDTERLLNTTSFDEIQRIFTKVCEFLQRRCIDVTARRIIKSHLCDKAFILTNNRFLAPRQVAFNCTHSCTPYLYGLSDYHRHNFGALLKLVGVKERFETVDYVTSLQDLHHRHESESLDRDTLRLAMQLVNLLNDSMAEQGTTLADVVNTNGSIYIPDSKGILRSASELCYNEPECEWVPTSESDNFSHHLIPYAISKQLGVNTSRQEVLSRHSKGIAFGQRERLTARIKRILSGYPCDKEILKELLQNADDAGATEIHFIKDPRQHGTERVFDKSWRPLQGPALCVYNNRPFSEEDLEGIQRLGEGSKGADPNKTGQYGIGFNCVYHLTDAPSFLTGGVGRDGSGNGSPDSSVDETLCIFDPHARFVPGASKEEPGRRFADVSRLRSIFTDIFPAYLEDKFDVASGTMFRLPLRTEDMAKESELSDHVITSDVIDSLFTRFRQDLFDCLQFLNSVETISLNEVDRLSGRVTTVYSVSALMSTEDQAARRKFTDRLKLYADKLKSGAINVGDIPPSELSYTISISDSKDYWERWLITQRIGVDRGTDINPSILDAFRRRELALMPRGGVAALMDSSDIKAALKRSRKVSCFLPLPIKSDLPVNINGHFALDHEARRNLWPDEGGEAGGGAKSEWNKLLLRQVIAPAYVLLLKRMSAELNETLSSAAENTFTMDDDDTSFTVAEVNPTMNVDFYCQLFPHVAATMSAASENQGGGYWYELTDAVYKRIHLTQELVLPVVRHSIISSLSTPQLSLDSSPTAAGNVTLQKERIEIEWLSTGGEGSLKAYFDNLSETFPDLEEPQVPIVGAPGTGGAPRLRRAPMGGSPAAAVVVPRVPRAVRLRRVLLSLGIKMLTIPKEIYENFRLASVDLEQVNPMIVIHFIKSSFSTPSFSRRSTPGDCPWSAQLPADVEKTPFRDVSTVSVIVEYCLQNPQYFYQNLDGLPLLLTESGRLRRFSSSDPVYLSPFHDLLPPRLADRFLHHELVGTVFKDEDLDDGINSDESSLSGKFLRFDVEAFASHLPDVLPREFFQRNNNGNGNRRIVLNEDMEDSDRLPNAKWLSKVWTFLRSEWNRTLEREKRRMEGGEDRGKGEVEELDERKIAEETLKPLGDWCLIPSLIHVGPSVLNGPKPSAQQYGKNNITTTSNSNNNNNNNDDTVIVEKFLTTVSAASAVMDYSLAGIMSQPVRQFLRRMGVMELNREVLDCAVAPHPAAPALGQTYILLPIVAVNKIVASSTANSSFARLVTSTLEDPRSVLKAVHFAVQNGDEKCLREDLREGEGERRQRSPLQREECLVLLKYFNDSLSIWEDNSDARTLLRGAPLHMTVDGIVTSLADHKVFVLHDDIPRCNMATWQRRAGIIFLQSNAALAHLYETLNCHRISVAKLYLDFVFLNFDYLTPEGRLTYLEYLRDIFLSQAKPDDRAAVVAALQTLEFVPDSEALLHRASEYVDRYHPVFKEMYAPDDPVFPAAPFGEFKWLDFMRLAGLQDKVSAESFVKFAEELAAEAETNPTEKTFNKARTLVIHLFKVKDLHSTGILPLLVDIPFIPASKGSAMYQKIHPAHGPTSSEGAPPKQKYIGFKEGISECHEVLTWTSSYLLPDWANPYKLTDRDICFTYDESNPLQELANYQRAIGRQLQIPERPSVDLVVEHVKHLCGTNGTNHSSPSGGTVEDSSQDFKAYLRMDVMKRVYQYLQVTLLEEGSLDNTVVVDGLLRDRAEFERTVAQLTELPCIVSNFGQQFVKPCQVVIDMYDGDQIIPYLFKAPTELGEFKNLFVRLGATNTATAQQYAGVLDRMHSHTAGEKLHPNELRLAFKAVAGLFTTLQKLKSSVTTLNPGAVMPDDTDILPTIDRLYLLTSTGHLKESTQIIFNDDVAYAERIKNLERDFLVNLAECQLKGPSSSSASVDTDYHRKLICLLPLRLRPVMLTSIVEEVMEDACLDTQVIHPVAEKLRYQLTSRAFAVGLVRLIRHEYRRSATGGAKKLRQQVLDAILIQLKKIHVYGVDQVMTYLALDGQRIPSSEAENECYVDKHIERMEDGVALTEGTEVTSWIVYINKSLTFGEELQVCIAEVVNKITGGLLRNSVHYIQPILSCAPHTISKVLDRLKIRPDNQAGGGRANGALGDGSAADGALHQSTLPPSGSFVPIEDHHLLREDFDEFEVGEYVGYELNDDLSSGDTMEPPALSSSPGGSVTTQTEQATFVYAIILKRVIDESGPGNSPAAAKARRLSQSTRRASISVPSDGSGLGGAPTVRQRLTQMYVISVGEEREPITVQATDLYKFHRLDRIAATTPIASSPSTFSAGSSPRVDSVQKQRRTSSGTQPESPRSSVNGRLLNDSHADSTPKNINNTNQLKVGNSHDLSSSANNRLSVYRQQNGGSTGLCVAGVSGGKEDGGGEDGVFEQHVREDGRTEASVKNEISETLEEAWKLPIAQRKKIVKRLLLKWHPDKNLEDETFATMVTQHIHRELERLELGLPRAKSEEAFRAEHAADPRNPFSGSETFQQNFYAAYQYFFEQMNQRAKEHREYRERYRENFTREYNPPPPPQGFYYQSPSGGGGGSGGDHAQPGQSPPSFRRNFSFEVPPTFASTNPQPPQAKRFLRQAQEDLLAADNDYDTKRPAYEWVCFKAHQAAEKALKASQFYVDAVTSYSHDLVILASSLEDQELRTLAQRLQRIVGNSAKLYNPDPIDFVVIPHDEYSQEMSENAVKIARAVLDRVKELVEHTE